MNPVSRVRYETGKSGYSKTCNSGPHYITKGGGNKFRRYTSTYAPEADYKKHLKYKDEIPTVMLNMVQIYQTTTLFLPTEENWRQATEEDHYLRYINSILYI